MGLRDTFSFIWSDGNDVDRQESARFAEYVGRTYLEGDKRVAERMVPAINRSLSKLVRRDARLAAHMLVALRKRYPEIRWKFEVPE